MLRNAAITGSVGRRDQGHQPWTFRDRWPNVIGGRGHTSTRPPGAGFGRKPQSTPPVPEARPGSFIVMPILPEHLYDEPEQLGETYPCTLVCLVQYLCHAVDNVLELCGWSPCDKSDLCTCDCDCLICWVTMHWCADCFGLCTMFCACGVQAVQAQHFCQCCCCTRLAQVLTWCMVVTVCVTLYLLVQVLSLRA